MRHARWNHEQTLRKPDIAVKLRDFYRQHYVANNMSLVILSNRSLDAGWTSSFHSINFTTLYVCSWNVEEVLELELSFFPFEVSVHGGVDNPVLGEDCVPLRPQPRVHGARHLLQLARIAEEPPTAHGPDGG